jgi:cob(I)alamin adenosyltransferase
MIDNAFKPPRILVFTGDGKGKTTAALGMALRACGHGQRVLFVQFIKADNSTGEMAAIHHLPGLELMQTGLGFVPRPNHPAYPAHQKAAREAIARIEQALRAGADALVVLDEVCTAISLGLVELQSVLNALACAKPGTNVVLTGRSAPNELIEKADTVTEMRCIKHAYQEGRGADPGVEW